MIEFNATEIPAVGATALRERVIAAVREGMAQAMEDLAAKAAEAAPVRTGALQRAILASPKVTETPAQIVGTVSGDVGRRHIALWQEKGILDPVVVARGKIMRAYFSGGAIGFIRRHGGFAVPGRPFMEPALEQQRQAIFDTIRLRIQAAVA